MTSKNIRVLLYSIGLFACGNGMGSSDGTGPDFWFPVAISVGFFLCLTFNLLSEED